MWQRFPGHWVRTQLWVSQKWVSSVPRGTQACELGGRTSFWGGSFLRPDGRHDASLIIMFPGNPGVLLWTNLTALCHAGSQFPVPVPAHEGSWAFWSLVGKGGVAMQPQSHFTSHLRWTSNGVSASNACTVNSHRAEQGLHSCSISLSPSPTGDLHQRPKWVLSLLPTVLHGSK